VNVNMNVDFELTGTMPILFHADDVEAGDELVSWRRNPENKNLSVAGDDRSPAWTWQTYLYTDGESLCWPAQNIMIGLRTGGAQFILKKQKTFKEATQSGLLITGEFCEFEGNGKQIKMESIKKLRDLPFRAQAEAAKDLGFRLFVKRAKIGTAKHVRVRARFEKWKVRGSLQVLVPEITFEILEGIFAYAGRAGQGDWRPSSPKSPGPFGMFEAKLKKSK